MITWEKTFQDPSIGNPHFRILRALRPDGSYRKEREYILTVQTLETNERRACRFDINGQITEIWVENPLQQLILDSLAEIQKSLIVEQVMET